MISCLMVTQRGRIALARIAMADFAAQTHADRELLVVHDGDTADHAMFQRATLDHAATIRIVHQPAGHTLGWLRNAAVAAAAGDYVCQWDDDDRYHPQRLALQWQAMLEAKADFCFLGDQLHWFPASAEMFWDDWNREAYPFNLVQGTLLGKRASMPLYPEHALGEDTGLLIEILRRGDPIARLRDAGWCYVYVYHGANAWTGEHHAAISRAKSLGLAALMRREGVLAQRLAEYQPGFGALRFPHAAGHLEFAAPTSAC